MDENKRIWLIYFTEENDPAWDTVLNVYRIVGLTVILALRKRRLHRETSFKKYLNADSVV